MSDIDIEKLPEGARKELRDFYEFLINKYMKKHTQNKNSNKNFEIFLKNPILVKKIILINREELHVR